MKYGHFENDKKEYVIERPDTPLPWINYLGLEEFFGMISNNGGGYSFMVDSRKQRITRYRYNNIPMDYGGRYFYVRDDKTGEYWSPTWMPVKAELDFYECRHGLGYTKITGEKNGLRISTNYFVPIGETLEVWETDIVNTTNEEKSFKIFSFVEFALWEALMDMTNLQRTLNLAEVEVEENIIYHKTEYRERRNHFAYFATSEKPIGFDTDKDSFVGQYNALHEPKVVQEGKSGNSIAHGWTPIGSHCLQITLKPGEKKSINFLLGFFANPANEKFEKASVINKKYVKPVIDRFLKRKESEEAFQVHKTKWNDMTDRFTVETPDNDVNTMVNIWNQYQCVITYNMARSTSYYETGIGRGIGFRDACQDLFGAVHILPTERTRQRILDLAAIQWRNGDCFHQYQLLDKKGNAEMGVGFNDDPCWLILATAAYIKETGDWDILKEECPFDNDPNDKASLWEHLITSFNYIVEHRGPHNLPLIGRADWNDCLNLLITDIKPGDTFQSDAKHAALDSEVGSKPESLMIAGQFVWAGKELVEMAKRIDDQVIQKEASEAILEMVEAINTHGWDGEWFLRAYDRNGNKIGSHENKEGQIFIEPQVFMGLAGVGLEDGKLQKAMDSLGKRLYSNHGVVLQQPAYTEYDESIGEITSYPPGVKENAGIFCHPNGWVVVSECVLGRGEEAMKYYRTICPAAREAISEVHQCEPYVYSQMIAGPDSPRFGQAKNSWLTGTATANFFGISQYILGIRPVFDGLSIDPCIPNEWEEFRVKRVFRGATFNIHAKNPKNVNKGVKTILIDGIEKNNKIITDFEAGATYNVEVVLG